MKEFVIYCIFIFTACFAAFGSCPSSMFHLTKAISLVFVETTFSINGKELSLKDIKFSFQIWEYLEKVFLRGLHTNYFDENNIKEESHRNIKILSENKLLGAPRLRQVRVRNDSCTIYNELKIFFNECFAEYSYNTEDKEAYGSKTGTLWTYSDPDHLNSISYWGKLASYRGGGYYVDLPLIKNESVLLLRNLKSSNWIDRHTRAVFLDFTVYNTNFNLFCIIKIVFERSPAGYIVSTSSIDTSNLLQFIDSFDYILLASECVYAIILVYYSLSFIRSTKKYGRIFLKDTSNVTDIVIIIISYAIITFDIYNFFYVYQKLGNLIKHSTEYLNFENLEAMRMKMNNFTAFLIFFLWMKLFKYLQVNIPMFQLSLTLTKCAKDILSFALIFLLIFSAFAQMATLMFGSKLYNYHNVVSSAFTLLKMVLGDFDFTELKETNRILGPVFFFTYIFIVFFILLNVFLAIITETYIQVRSQENIRESGIWSSLAAKMTTCRNFIFTLLRLKKKSKNSDTEEPMLSKTPSSEDVVTLPHITSYQDPEYSKDELQNINIEPHKHGNALFLNDEKELKNLILQITERIQKTLIKIDIVFDKIKIITDDSKSIDLQTTSNENN